MRTAAIAVVVVSLTTTMRSSLWAQNKGDTLRLTVAEARSLALKNNPDLLAERLTVDVARGELRQVSAIALNPTADVLPARSGLGEEIAVSQELEIAGQRAARVRAGRAGVARADAQFSNARRLTLADVERAFYRVAAAYQRTDLARAVVALNQNLADIAARQVKEGEISRLDFNLASVELGRSKARLLANQSEREQFELELRRLIGSPQESHIVPIPDSTHVGPRFNAEDLVAFAIQNRADILERSAAVQQADALATVARRERMPNLNLRAVSEENDSGNRVVRPAIGLTIPLFQRNSGEVNARSAAARQARLQRDAVATRIRAEVKAAVSAYNAAADRVALLETSVLPQARENRRLLEIAYREGEVGLPVLLLIRNQVIDAELEYWDAWLARHEALTAMEEAAGREIPR